MSETRIYSLLPVRNCTLGNSLNLPVLQFSAQKWGQKCFLPYRYFRCIHGRKKQWGGDSLLRGTQEPLCCSDRESWEVCCLLGAEVWDVKRLVKSTDFCPSLPLQVGINDTASRNQDKIKENYKALDVRYIVHLNNLVTQVIFYCILPVRKKSAARNRHIMQTNFCLSGRCCHEGFGSYNYRTSFDYYSKGGMGYFCLKEARE